MREGRERVSEEEKSENMVGNTGSNWTPSPFS